MRRVTDERGAVAVTVALLLVGLLGMAAFVLDVGAMYQERRELQNGADAAALAIAENCARGLATCDSSQLASSSTTYLNGNALDGASNYDSGTLDLSKQQVTINASTKTAGGATSIPFNFAQILGFSGKHVTASATARWGYPSTFAAVPLTIDSCSFYTNNYSTTPVDLLFHQTGGNNAQNGTPCPAHTSGLDFPGGFGWINDGSSGTCSVSTAVGSPAYVDPGNNTPTGCKANNYQIFEDWLTGADKALPVYDNYQNQGNGGKYYIAGYASFHLVGWQMNGNTGDGDRTGCGNSSCLRGYFTKQVLSTSASGGTVNFGVISVSLTS